MTEIDTNNPDVGRRRKIRLGSRTVELPQSRLLRMGIGGCLIFCGMLGFLPVLGFWMIPLGFFVLSLDMHWARKLRRRFAVSFTRRFPRIAGKLNGMSQ